ncbi:hypothetical protein MesoLj113c_11890 [Mesorhizobium sp. 113-3-9]|nr:hypothetical protein MesoLj113c_11890 [Mesorhizobium sp. 113-3-9]
MADQTDALARPDMKIDPAQRANGAEMFFGAVQSDDVSVPFRHAQRYPLGDTDGNAAAMLT